MLYNSPSVTAGESFPLLKMQCGLAQPNLKIKRPINTREEALMSGISKLDPLFVCLVTIIISTQQYLLPGEGREGGGGGGC